MAKDFRGSLSTGVSIFSSLTFKECHVYIVADRLDAKHTTKMSAMTPHPIQRNPSVSVFLLLGHKPKRHDCTAILHRDCDRRVFRFVSCQSNDDLVDLIYDFGAVIL